MSDTVIIDIDSISFWPIDTIPANCFDENGGIILLPPDSISLENYTFSIDNINVEINRDSLYELPSGSYALELSKVDGCSARRVVEISSLPEIFTNLPNFFYIEDDPEVEFTLEVTGGTGPYQIEWQTETNTGLSCQSCFRPIFTPIVSQNYSLLVQDIDGCEITQEVFIAVNRPKRKMIPNAFTPNFDGINDYFEIYGEANSFKIRQMQIFDRWGGNIFEASNYFVGEPNGRWDGTFRGKPASSGIYLATFEIEWPDGIIEKVSQSVWLTL